MTRYPERAEEVREELVGLVQEWGEETLVGTSVLSEIARRLIERPSEEHGRLAVERVRDGSGRVDPPETMIGERQTPEERREDAHRMAAGADVVREPGERERGRPDSAADLVPRFEDPHRDPGLRERDRGGESVGSRADDDGVVHPAHASP